LTDSDVVKVPAVLIAHYRDVAIPGRFIVRPIAGEAIDAQVHKLARPCTTDRVVHSWWRSNEVARAQGKPFLVCFPDSQLRSPLKDEEDLFGVAVDVKWRSLAWFENNEEGFRGIRISAVHDQVIRVRGKSVPNDLTGVENILRHPLLPQVPYCRLLYSMPHSASPQAQKVTALGRWR
jgi:hypothetical protein